MLSRDEARELYNRFGAKQDAQGYYEDPPLRHLIDHCAFANADAVCEFGCGTGRFAADLLANHLPPRATYFGYDLSSTMITLASERLTPFGDRATLQQSDGHPKMPLEDASVDRFISTYVLDLLSIEDIRAVVGEARRVLRAGGVLGVVGLTTGNTLPSRVTSSLWQLAHSLAPSKVGGCRPLELLSHIDLTGWDVVHREVVVAAWIASEVVVLRRP